MSEIFKARDLLTFHVRGNRKTQGCGRNTFTHEQKELSRIILQIVNSQLEHHIKALDQAGVDTDQFIKEFQQQTQQRQQQAQKTATEPTKPAEKKISEPKVSKTTEFTSKHKYLK